MSEIDGVVVDETWTCGCGYMAIGVVCTKCGTVDPRFKASRERIERKRRWIHRIEGFFVGFVVGVVYMAAMLMS